MITRIIRTWIVGSLLMLELAGCGQAKPPAEKPAPITPTLSSTPSATPAPPAKNAIQSVAPEKESVQTPLVATAAEGTAEAAFQKTLIAFQEGHLDTVFEFLPDSFQADAQNLVHEFAGQMDAELWSKSFDLLTRITRILQSKKSLILNLDNVKKSPQFETIKFHWDSIASGLQDVVTSEISNLNSLKKCDVKEQLRLASQLLVDKGLPLPKFGDVSVTTVESNEMTAILSYRESKDAEPKQVEFVKIEGKWLPKSIAQSWPDVVARVRARLVELPGQVAAIKPAVMEQLEGLNGILDQVEKARTPEQFNGAVMSLFVSVALGKGFAEQALREAETSPRKANAVYLIINRELSDKEQTKLKDLILTAVDDPNVEYEIIPNDGKTRFRFTPVPKLNVVTDAIQKEYDGAKLTEDAETRTIRVELK